MRDEHDAGGEPVEEALEPLEAREVEVVRRLVEQEDVEAREQDRGERGAGRFAAGQRRHLAVGAPPETDVRRARRRPRLEVLAAEREEAVERVRVGARELRLGAEPGRERVHLLLGCADAGAPREVVAHRLARARLRLLREVPDGARADDAGPSRAARARRGRGAGSTCRSRSGRRCRCGRPARRRARRGRAPGRRRSSSRCHEQTSEPGMGRTSFKSKGENACFRLRDPSWDEPPAARPRD